MPLGRMLKNPRLLIGLFLLMRTMSSAETLFLFNVRYSCLMYVFLDGPIPVT
jgi:hypothetical protein